MHGALFDTLLEASLDDAVDVDARRMNLARRKLARLDDLLDLDDGDLARRGGQGIEVLRRMAIDHVTVAIGFPALDDGEAATIF